MATSGNFTSNNAGSSYPNPCNLRFEWWQTGRNEYDNWTDIQFHLKATGGRDGYWTYYNNIQLNVDGQQFSAGRIQAYNGQVLLAGSKRIYHDQQGNRSFGANASAGIYANATNSWGNGNWSLDNIPRYSNIRGADNFNDEQNPRMWFTNPSGGRFRILCKIEAGGNNSLITREVARNATECRFNLSQDERNRLLDLCKTSKKLAVGFTVSTRDNDNRELHWEKLNRTMTVVNGDPTFSTFTYQDKNSTATSVTGNDQIAIQGVSKIEAQITASNKATAKKRADIKSYTAELSGASKTANYSSTSTVTLGQFDTKVSGNQTLSITAKDGRGFTKRASKTITVLPYAKPVIAVRGTRRNNFETDTTIHIEGKYSPLKVGAVEKNEIQTVQYRYKKQNSSTYSSWIQGENLVAKDGSFKVSDKLHNFDNNEAWDVQVQVIDKLNTVTVNTTVSAGIPLFRIGTDGYVYNNEQPLMPSHVGQVIMSTTLNTADKVQAIYGGTWTEWGKGRVPVGVDPNDNDFKTPNKTGGTKTVTLNESQIPSHTHKPIGGGDFVLVDSSVGQSFGFANGNYYNLRWKNGGISGATGGNKPHPNLPPYQALYMWVRTA